MWRSRRWRRLLNLIDRLPAACHLADAQAQDAELAQVQVEHMDTHRQADPSRSFLEWTPEAELLTYVGDVLNQLVAITVAVNSKDGKMQRVDPLPRPKRALDALLVKVRDDLADAWIAEIEAAQGPREV